MEPWYIRLLTFLGIIEKKAQDEVHAILTTVNDGVNKLKAFAASPEGLTLEGIAATLAPGLEIAYKNWLPELFTAMNWVNGANKTLDQITAEGLAYLNSTVGNIRATQFTALSANSSTWVADNTGVVLPIQHALVMAPIVYKGPEAVAEFEKAVPISEAQAVAPAPDAATIEAYKQAGMAAPGADTATQSADGEELVPHGVTGYLVPKSQA
jgi:hypothetical protein